MRDKHYGFSFFLIFIVALTISLGGSLSLAPTLYGEEEKKDKKDLPP